MGVAVVITRGTGGHIQPGNGDGTSGAPRRRPAQVAEAWTRWLTDLEKRALVEGPNWAQAELADALANAGFPALADAIAVPTRLDDTAWRYFRAAGISGFTPDDVLDRRPDLTTEQAQDFLLRRDDQIADAAGLRAGETMAFWLEQNDEVPDPPPDEVLEAMQAARELLVESGEPHDPLLLLWEQRELAPAGCGECGACDLKNSADPHECQLSDAYHNPITGATRCGSCFETMRVRRRREA
jgi:hypothetical protein